MLERVDRRFFIKALGVSLSSLMISPLETLAAPVKEEKMKELRCPIYYWHEVESRREFKDFVEGLLDNDYFPIAMRDIVDYFYEDLKVWPEDKKPAVITFDDGRLSQFETALPILDLYRLRATFFVLQNYADDTNKYMDDSQIKILSSGGWEAGVHGFTHMPLPTLRVLDQKAWRDDVIAAKLRLEDLIGEKVVSFAYPYGRSGGVDKETRSLVAENYKVAVSTGGNAPFLKVNELYELPRLWKS